MFDDLIFFPRMSKTSAAAPTTNSHRAAYVRARRSLAVNIIVGVVSRDEMTSHRRRFSVPSVSI